MDRAQAEYLAVAPHSLYTKLREEKHGDITHLVVEFEFVRCLNIHFYPAFLTLFIICTLLSTLLSSTPSNCFLQLSFSQLILRNKHHGRQRVN